MQTKTKKMIAVSILAILFVLLMSTKASAYVLIGGRFTRGVGNTCYYVDSTASSYTSRINAAANNWVHTEHGANPIYMTAVSSSHGTHIDLYGKYDSFWGNTGRILGETKMFNSAAQDITSQTAYTNWVYAEIYLNRNLLNTSTDNTQGTIAHEMGHCFGLNENNGNIYSIMCQTGAGRAVYQVGADDNNGINAIY